MNTEHHYAVAVGIDQYPALSDLRHARADAEAVDGWLGEHGGVDQSRRTLVRAVDLPPGTTRDQAVPVKKEVWEALYDKLTRIRAAVEQDPTVWPSSRLYFFFSGHGLAPTARDAAGLAADAGPDHFGNAVSLKALTEWLLESQDFAELVVIADSCRNKPPTGTLPSGPPWNPRRTNRGEVRVAEFYATIYGDPAREPRPDVDPDKQRGYFTNAIIDGLNGAARVGPGGSISTVDLGSYARQRVMRETDNRQKPPQDVGADFVVVDGVTPTAQPTRPVRIAFPAGFTGAVELQDAGFRVIHKRDVDDAPWDLELEPSLYQVVATGDQPLGSSGLFQVPRGEGVVHVTL